MARGRGNLPFMQRLDEGLVAPAGPADAGALARIHVQSWRETYEGLLPAAYLAGMDLKRHARSWSRRLVADRGEVVLIAEGRDGAVGYCAGMATPGGGAEVSTLYVLRQAQGLGLGACLLTSTARVLRAGGVRSIHLWVLDGNLRARGFYERLGGIPKGSRPVAGWGGGLIETAYAWATISDLIDRGARRP